MILYKLLIISTALLLIATGIATMFVYYPLSQIKSTSPQTSSITSFAEAITAAKQFDTTEASLLDPACTTQIRSHGYQTKRVIVLLHGYTNCPQQFSELGERLFAQGYNVFIPRMPGHGYADKMTDALAYISDLELRTYLHESITIADHLGEDVTVLGLSVGGTLSMWASLFEASADRSIVLAPVAYPSGFAPWLRNAVVRYAAWTPNTFSWWNKDLQDKRPSPPYVYHRYASKSLASTLHMVSHIEQTLPKTSSHKPITFIINEGDPALNANKLYQLRDLFATHGMQVQTHTYSEAQQLPHDLIDPYNIKEHKEQVYQDLIRLVEEIYTDT